MQFDVIHRNSSATAHKYEVDHETGGSSDWYLHPGYPTDYGIEDTP